MAIEFLNPTADLVIIRSIGPLSLDDAHGLAKKMSSLFLAGKRDFCACVDLRRCGVVSAPIADFFVELLRRDNPLIKASAFLLSPADITLGMQAQRMIREANNPRRQSFHDIEALYLWLSGSLSPDAQKALRDYLKNA